jgi:hypothetical protein
VLSVSGMNTGSTGMAAAAATPANSKPYTFSLP